MIALISFALGVFLLRFLFRNKYIAEFQTDKLVDTDNKTYSVYSLSDEGKKYIDNYSIFDKDGYRFCNVTLRENVTFIEYNVICYVGEKVFRILRIKSKDGKIKNKYLIKIPSEATSIKISVLKGNEEIFETKDINTKIKIKAIICALVLSISASLISFFVHPYLVNSTGGTGIENWSVLISKILDEYIFYILGGVTLLISCGLIIYLLLFFNNEKTKKKRKISEKEQVKKQAREEKKYNELIEKSLTIDNVLSFKTKTLYGKDDKPIYVVIKPKVYKGFLHAKIIIFFIDKNGQRIGTLEKEMYKNFGKIYVKANEKVENVECFVESAVFEDFTYKNNKFSLSESRGKPILKGNILRLKGMLIVTLIAAMALVTNLGYTFYNDTLLQTLRNSEAYFEISYINEELPELGYKTSGYNGQNKIAIVPTWIDGKYIDYVGSRTFGLDCPVEKVYFDTKVDLEARAFADSNIKYVDFDNVRSIGASCFSSSSLDYVVINSTIKYDNYCFSGMFISGRVDINLDSINAGRSIFSGAIVKGGIHLIKVPTSINYFTFRGYSYDIFIYDNNGVITENNYNSYISSTNYYLEKDCVHDEHSFFLNNGKVVNQMNGKLVSETKGTCVKKGTLHYNCNYCHKNYDTTGTYDRDNHNFVNGYCKDCGKKEPEND